ncbi:hypothetical protein EKL15_19825 [Serratia sp. 4542]|nr:hypothetical protein [Serratia sp. 4542]
MPVRVRPSAPKTIVIIGKSTTISTLYNKPNIDGNYKWPHIRIFVYKTPGRTFSLTPCFVNLSPRNF